MYLLESSQIKEQHETVKLLYEELGSKTLDNELNRPVHE